jgi:hypothetical protein
MADFLINYSVPRMYQIRGGKLIDGYETEFFITEFGTTSTVKTPTNDADVIRKAINEEISRVRKVHALGSE